MWVCVCVCVRECVCVHAQAYIVDVCLCVCAWEREQLTGILKFYISFLGPFFQLQWHTYVRTNTHCDMDTHALYKPTHRYTMHANSMLNHSTCSLLSPLPSQVPEESHSSVQPLHVHSAHRSSWSVGTPVERGAGRVGGGRGVGGDNRVLTYVHTYMHQYLC